MPALFIALIVYLLIYHRYFSDDFKSEGSNAQWISLSVALFAGIICWMSIKNISNSAGGYMIGPGILGAFFGSMVGLWGPILLLPSNNLAPLSGMLVVTPAGLLGGIALGLMQWKAKKERTKIP